jgi:hypothetical protein
MFGRYPIAAAILTSRDKAASVWLDSGGKFFYDEKHEPGI